jgi:hypothetical protein
MTRVRFPPAPKTHRDRVERAVERRGLSLVGRVKQAVKGGVTALPVDERWLAGVAAYSDRDGARVVALLSDESRRVRGVALGVAPHACDDAQATAALEAAWGLRGERRLLRRMSRHGRTAAIDGFLDGLAANGQLRDLVDDLPFGSEACVRRHLAHAIERPSRRFWDGVALGHPGVLGELLAARWQAVTGEGDPVTRQLTDRHHPRLAERVPDAALAIAELLLARGIDPAHRVWTELLRRRPDATVELAIRFAARVPGGALAGRVKELEPALLGRIMGNAPHLLGAFGPRVRRLSPDRQRALALAWRDASERFPVHGAYLLRYLPADDARERAYERWSLAARDRDGAIAPELVAALPIELAAREARRHLFEVTALQIDADRRLRGLARYLPWTELEPALKDHLGHPEGLVRALALSELLANPGVYPDDASLPARALELVVARKFEQDPVRHAMLSTLGRWPRRVWRAEHLPAIAQAVRDGLDASDFSVASASAAEHLIVRMFGVDGEWAARWLATMIKERGMLHDANLGAKLSDLDLGRAAPHLVAIAKTWVTQERAPWLIAFATGIGRRLGMVTGLSELLVNARMATATEWVATSMSDVLARFDPARHAATLKDILARARSRSWHQVVFHLANIDGLVGRQAPRVRDRRRPTLVPAIAEAVAEIARELDPRYAGTALSILRRRDPQTFDRVVAEVVAEDASVAIVADVHRWLHRHRQDLLGPYIDGRKIRGRFATGRTSWVLPFRDGFFRWTPSQVEQLATLLESIVGDKDRDTPTVFSALTIWPAMEYASMDRLCALARDPRPFVQDKAIRVLSRCDAGQGVPTLLECLGDARARFAIYGLRRALFNMVPDRALAIVAGVPMAKVTVAKEVVRLTGELRAAGAFARLLDLAGGTLHRDIRIALLRALWDHLDREPTWAIFEAAVGDRDWVVASRLADIPANRLTRALDARLSALLARVVARPEPEARIGLLARAGGLALVDPERALLAACRDRLRSPFDDEVRYAVDAILKRSDEADMPALAAALDALRADPRALHVAAAAMCAVDLRARASWRLAGEQLQAAALHDPRWSSIAIAAAAARRTAHDLLAAVAAAPLDLDAALAFRAALATLPDDELEPLVAGLVPSRSPAARRLAVFALEHDARPGRGWTAPRLAHLTTLRTDPDPSVAGAAARLWPPREQDPGF